MEQALETERRRSVSRRVSNAATESSRLKAAAAASDAPLSIPGPGVPAPVPVPAPAVATVEESALASPMRESAGAGDVDGRGAAEPVSSGVVNEANEVDVGKGGGPLELDLKPAPPAAQREASLDNHDWDEV